LERNVIDNEQPIDNTVVVAGIGCSGNMVHMLEKEQPFGIHGIHGRSLPIAMGIKMGNPDLNVVVVAGDGDFLGIGMEHIGPQAMRNVNMTAIVMDNGVYGLTKGQSSPTTDLGVVTSSTPYGKMEPSLHPLRTYLTMGVSYIASTISNKVKDMSQLMYDAMNHPGFSIVHVQSPCTEYNNTYEALKGSPKKGIEPLAYDIPDGHDPEDVEAAQELVNADGIPLGLVYKDLSRPSFDQKAKDTTGAVEMKSPESFLESFKI
jgi:2-oxoglutarate ferredoxin oxidoreductase subunit beta